MSKYTANFEITLYVILKLHDMWLWNYTILNFEIAWYVILKLHYIQLWNCTVCYFGITPYSNFLDSNSPLHHIVAGGLGWGQHDSSWKHFSIKHPRLRWKLSKPRSFPFFIRWVGYFLLEDLSRSICWDGVFRFFI